jgi:hypothetical protein
VDLREHRLHHRRLVPHHADAQAGRPEVPQAGEGVGVEVRGVEPPARAPGLLGRPLPLEVEAGADQLEGAPVVLPPLDDDAERGEEVEGADAEPVGPRRPATRLVDQRLAQVEDHRLHRHGSSV